LSLITLLAGIGLILFVVGKFDYSGWKGEEGGSAYMMHSVLSSPKMSPLKLTPSQGVTGWFFGIGALLFLAQAFPGGAFKAAPIAPPSCSILNGSFKPIPRRAPTAILVLGAPQCLSRAVARIATSSAGQTPNQIRMTVSAASTGNEDRG